MRNGGLLPPMGGEGNIVEADETYYGKTDQPLISKQRKERLYKAGSRSPREGIIRNTYLILNIL